MAVLIRVGNHFLASSAHRNVIFGSNSGKRGSLFVTCTAPGTFCRTLGRTNNAPNRGVAVSGGRAARIANDGLSVSIG